MTDAPSFTTVPSENQPLRRELKGNLRDVPLAVILQTVKARKLTGDLTFLRGNDKVTVQVSQGAVVFASSNDPASRLGEWLLMRGKISVAQYDESVRLLQETGARQGTILLQLGYIPPLELERAVRQQIADILLELFNWTNGEYRFSPAERLDEAITLDISLTELIIKGIGQTKNWPMIHRGLQPFDGVLQINKAFDLEEARRVRLSREEDSILQMVDGKRTVQEIAASSPFQLFPTCRTLFAFKAASVLMKKR